MAELILYIVAKLLYLVFSPIGFVYAIIRVLTRVGFKEAWKQLRRYFMAIAVSIDQKGNVIMQELFNDLLIRDMFRLDSWDKDEPYHIVKKIPFGNEDETISSVLGKNYINGTLTPMGKLLDWVLCKLEPNHSIKSIEENP